MDLETFLSPSDSARALRTLATLSRHSTSPLVLTGGLAIEAHLALRGISPMLRPLNDVDFLVDSFDQIPRSLASEFLFRHVHPEDAPGKTLLQCVDPETSVRVDIFRAYGGTTARAARAEIQGVQWRMISFEDLAARTARLCLDLAIGEPVPAKHARDFIRLLQHASAEQMQSVWFEHRKPNHPELFSKAASQLADLIASRPELQIEPVYSQDLQATCSRCRKGGNFVLADRRLQCSRWRDRSRPDWWGRLDKLGGVPLQVEVWYFQ